MTDVAFQPMEGTCSCRGVRYRMTAAPLFVHCCHCTWCQRETGSAFVLNAMVEAECVEVLAGSPLAIDTPSNSGRGQKITRCPRCYVALWSNYPGGGDAIRFVRVGTLDKPGALKPDVHIYTGTKARWLKLPKRTPSFRDYYNTSKLWPKASLKRLNAALGRTKS